jgi:hypothetical protein
MQPDQKARLREFYNQLVDRPLEPDDKFYEPFVAEEGSGDPIQDLATRISWSEAASVNLLSGQRGSGKSTELRRLRKILHDDGCEVFLCDMRDYMNLTTPVEITDFLMSVMGALNEEVYQAYQQNMSRQRYWERLVHFLMTDVQIKDLKLETGLSGTKVGLTASLKDDPTFKRRLQEHLRGHVARIVQQAHEFATEVVTLIRTRHSDPNKKVVLLIDSVEQIRGVGTDDADRVHRSVTTLFSGHADSLHLPLLHVVYTIPPYLTPLAPGLGQLLGGGTVCSLPSVHIQHPDRTPDENGLEVMSRIMNRRYHTWRQIFTLPQLQRMALATGGDLRDFFRLVRDCLVKASSIREMTLPVTDTVIQSAENHLRRDMLPIATEDAVWLKRIAESKRPELESIAELPRLARFFDTKLVLNYRNDEDWYDIHPLLRDILEGDPL